MDVDLRIPVTAEQESQAQQAAAATGQDMATWERAILLDAAKREMARGKGTQTRSKLTLTFSMCTI